MNWVNFSDSLQRTLLMTIISTALAYLIGLPLGILLNVTSKNGIRPNRIINSIIGVFVNIMRSVPCLLLIIVMIPVTNIIFGKGSWSGRWYSMIVPLVAASFGLIARNVEQSLSEVPKGEIEAARSMGASNIEIIFNVLLVEARPSLLLGLSISSVSILGYTSFAGYIGAGGLIVEAFNLGYYGTDKLGMWLCIGVVVLLVQVIQEVGSLLVRKYDKRRR